LNVLNRSKGPAISMIIPSCPKNPSTTFRTVGTGAPSGFL
jgi:hypothetical protein